MIYYEKSYEIFRNIFKTDNHPSIACIFNNMACFFKIQKKNKEALVYFEKSLEIKRNIFKTEDHPSVSKTMRNQETIEDNLSNCIDSLEFFRF